MASPNPVPPAPVLVLLDCTNLSNTASSSSGGMPGPWSRNEILTEFCARLIPTSIVPPAGENLIALSRRLRSTCLILSASSVTDSPNSCVSCRILRFRSDSSMSISPITALTNIAGSVGSKVNVALLASSLARSSKSFSNSKSMLPLCLILLK